MCPPRLCLRATVALLLGATSLHAIIDRNGDGLSDVWTALYHPTNVATADEDGDGFTNAQEALAGTDPLNAASRFAAAPCTDDAGNLVLRWRGAWGKRYLIESSADLKTWTALPALHVGRGQELSVVVRAAGAAAEARRYWRVVVADVDTDGDGMTSAEEIELGSDPTVADATLGTPRVYGAEYFVSPTGNDTNAGTKAAPFKTFTKAQSVVRAQIKAGMPAGGIAVWLRGGVYERTTELIFGSADSGTSAANSVDWRGYPGEEARIVGGRRYPATLFSPVTSTAAVWSRLDAAARGKVLQLDLKAQGVTDFGTLKVHGWGTDTPPVLEVFVDAQPMALARWPDAEAHAMPPPIDPNADRITVHGSLTPAVAGTYVKFGTQDGVSAFRREGLVDGQQYHLRRGTFIDQAKGTTSVVWFLTTSASAGWDASTAPSWRCWGAEPATFTAVAASGAVGQPSVLDPARINRGYAYTADPTTITSFTYAGDRPARWTQAPDGWLDGFWGNSWAEFHLPLAGADPANGLVSLGAAPPFFGLLPNQPWFAYNLLEEITQPGEWYLDRAAGVLYLWPPAGFTAGSEVVVSIPNYVLHPSSAKFLAFRDLTIEAARSVLVTSWQVQGLELERLVLRNAGALGVNLSGSDSVISRCLVTGAGRAGFLIQGGDRATLTASNNVVEDCEIREVGRTQISGAVGIEIDGCGQTLRHNRVHHLPRGALTLRGNNQKIEFNELHDVCLGSADSGAIYAPGDWGARGDEIRGNFIHDIRNELGSTDVQGIYLDETSAGTLVEGNVVYGVAGYAFKINGGRDNLVRRNVAARCGGVLYSTDWGLRQFNHPTEIELLKQRHQRLLAFGYRSPAWSAAYPACAAIPDTWDAVAADPLQWLAPRGNELVGNLCFANARWQNYYSYLGPDPVATYFQAVAENVQTQTSPFVDEAGGDLRLRPDSPAAQIPGWVAIPFERIGVRE
ncbi:MAG TPA: right-handed parallel beta-helix repeat-containing protein [Opitutaceae bacterium]|nr:right-handed parallel beta-helix repeat-containing protein [Opitutaceae bacterium]